MPTELPYDNSLDGLERNIKYVVERLERVEQRLGITPPPPQPAEPDDDRNWAARSWRPSGQPTVPPAKQPDEQGWVSLPELTPQPPKPQPAPRPSVVGPVTPLPPKPQPAPPVAAATPPTAAPLPDVMGIPNPVGAEQHPISPPSPAPPTPVKAARDWENLIGGKWALWVGLFSLFLAIASFLAYTWQTLPPMPPAGRLAAGIGAGLGMLAAGSFFGKRVQRWFSEGLMGGGLAVLYLSVWIGAQQYHLLPFTIAFSAMTLITMLGVYLAVRNNALSLSLLATSGGFLTPLMLSSGAGSGAGSMSLLTYVAVLNTGILGVSLFKRWNSLTWLSFVSTVLLLCGWSLDNYSTAAMPTVLVCCTLYFLMYIGAACFYSLVRREETAASDLLLLFAVTSVYTLGGYAMLFDADVSQPAWFALGLMVFFSLLSRVTALASPHNVALRRCALGIAISLLTVAVPLLTNGLAMQLQGTLVAIGWSAEAAALLVLGMRLRSRLLQAAGHWVWALALLAVVSAADQNPGTAGWLFVNERALPLLVSIVAIVLVLAQHWVIARQTPAAPQDDAPASPDVAARPVLTDSFAPLYAIYAVSGSAWLLAQETYLWFERAQRAGMPHWQLGANFTIAMVLAIYAVAAFAIGLRVRDSVVRQSALAVLALAVCIPIGMPMWTGLSARTPDWPPFWNLRLLAYGVVALMLGVAGWLVMRYRSRLGETERSLMGVWPVASACFALLGATIELYSSFDLARGQQWELNALFATTVLWSVSAILIAQVASALRLSALRRTALVIGVLGSALALVISLAYDGAQAPLFWNWRTLAFGVSGLLLWALALSEKRQATATPPGQWPQTTTACVLLGCLILLWGVSLESHSAFAHYKSTLGEHWELQAAFFLSVLWSVCALGLLGAGLRWKQMPVRVFAYLVWGLALGMLVFTTLGTVRLGWAPALNARFIAFLFCGGVGSWAASLLHRHAKALEPGEENTGETLAWLSGLLLLGGLTQEIYESCYFYRVVLGGYWPRWAQMFISVAWSVCGTGLLVAGINRSYKSLRLAALGLLSCTVIKVFLFDLGFLSGLLRMFSLAGLGLALIFISWLYSRYGKEEEEA